MNKNRLWPLILCFLVAIALVFTIAWIYHFNHHPSQQPPNHGHPQQPKKHKILWGVDTASKVSNSFYQCVDKNYGKPDIWGRYMDSKTNISTGLTKKEASFIHQKGGKILLIFNHFSNATGYHNGVSAAHTAISDAKNLGVPKGTALFADVEPTYSVDASFLTGWAKTLSASPYKAGLYGDFSKGSDLQKAYQSSRKKLDDSPILWTNHPRPGITSAKKAPDFHPATSETSATLAWQYGIGAKKCNIDTDLAQSGILQYLWK